MKVTSPQNRALPIVEPSVNTENYFKKFFISRPEVKWWKFSASNLTKQHGFFKYFLYIWRILKRFTDDRYLGLRNAVEAFNSNNNEENLEKIIKHISLLKGNLFTVDEHDSLVRVANEVILYKCIFLKKSHFEYDSNLAETVESFDAELKEAIKIHNQEKTEHTAKQLLEKVFDWMQKFPNQYAKKYSNVQRLLLQVASGFKDEKLFFDFNLLQNEATQNVHRRLRKLNFAFVNYETPLDLPQMKAWFPDKRLQNLQKAISLYNQKKDKSSYDLVITQLIKWQFTDSQRLHKHDTQRLIKQLIKISRGISKQQEIKEDEAFQFLEVLCSKEDLSFEGWKNLALPQGINLESLTQFNKKKNQTNFKNLVSEIKKWIDTNPEEYLKKGKLLVKQIQIQAIKLLYIEPLKIEEELSEELENVHLAIKKYNQSLGISDFKFLKETVQIWKSQQRKEYDFFQGKSFEKNLSLMNPIYLPSSHPSKILDNTLRYDDTLTTNAYIVNFHNTVAPWSHTEVVFAKKVEDIIEVDEKESELARTAYEYIEPYLDEYGYLKKLPEPFWDNLTLKFSSHMNYLIFLRYVLSCTIKRKFSQDSLMRRELTPKAKKSFDQFVSSHKLFNISSGWEKKIPEDALFPLNPYRETILYVLCKKEMERNFKREYLGIGADAVFLDSEAAHAEGIHLVDDSVASRMEKLCHRRKNEIQKVMNVFAGGKQGLLSFMGEWQKQLSSKEEKVRHIRQALIDNFMTEMNPNAFYPDYEETRYRLELYESGGQIYEKWIEDDNGKFARIKSPSSQNISGEFIDGIYQRNPYILVDKKLVSLKRQYKNVEYEWGNIIFKEDGSETWVKDEENGQQVKNKKGDIIQINGPFYSSQSCEKYLNDGESEWCGSYAIRMMHSAYAFEHMSEFKNVLFRLNCDFESSTKSGGGKFDKLHAKMLFKLADGYAKKIVMSEIGRKYFRDMNERIKFSSRGSPDMLQKSLQNIQPSIANIFKRAWQVIVLHEPEDLSPSWKIKLLFKVGQGLVGLIGLPFAILKLAYNVAAAAVSLFFDMSLSFKIGYEKAVAKWERAKESGLKPCFSILGETLFFGINKSISRIFKFIDIENFIPKSNNQNLQYL